MSNKHKLWGMVVGIAASTWMITSITYNILIVRSAHDQLGDFGSFIASGIEIRNGGNPYGTSSPLIFEAHFPRYHVGGKLPNLNPPISLLFFQFLPDENFLLSANLWRVLSLIIYIVAILVLATHYKPTVFAILWVFSLAGLWHTIGLGQIYTPILLIIILAWLSFENKRELVGGILLGLLASIKPNFIIWILLFLPQKKWGVILASALTAILIALLPLSILPLDTYAQWMEAAHVDASILSMPGNSSFMGLTSRVGYPEIGIGLAALAFIATAILIYRADRNNQETPPMYLNSAGILLCLLASPISWVGYTIFTIPFFLSCKKWQPAVIIPAIMLTLPFNFTMHFYYNFGRMGFIFWGWWYGLALIISLLFVLTEGCKSKFSAVEHKILERDLIVE